MRGCIGSGWERWGGCEGGEGEGEGEGREELMTLHIE